MLYVIYGTGRDKVRARAKEVLVLLSRKRPEAEQLFVDDESVSVDFFREYVSAQGLFERKVIVEADQVLSAGEVKDFVLKEAEALAESENVFLFLESELDKKALKVFEEQAFKIEAQNLAKPAARKDFSAFSLSDALIARDRVLLWRRYREAVERGYALEELYGIMFWQLKSLLLVKAHKSAKEAGMKQYPWQKSSKGARNYETVELLELSRELVRTYHEARLESHDLEATLERFILRV